MGGCFPYLSFWLMLHAYLSERIPFTHSPTVPSTIYFTISSQWIKSDPYCLPVKYKMMRKFSHCAFANHKPLFSFIHINSYTSQEWNPVILCCLGILWKLGVLYVSQLKSFSCQVFCLVFIFVTVFLKDSFCIFYLGSNHLLKDF